MEILKPVETIESPEQKVYNENFSGTHINPKNVEFLAFLGLKDEMFNDKVMEKVAYLSERIDLNELENLALKYGNDGNMSKLDKILVWAKLNEQELDYQKKLDIIKSSKEQL